MTAPAPRPLALVQHGHQYLITDGYDNHEGLSEVLEGFAAILALHLDHRVPLNLHLSGTLIEAIAWHDPGFFGRVREVVDAGLAEMIGSAYSQNILTLFSESHNERQLDETLRLYRRHLGVDPADVRGFWVPERVWDTGRLAPLLRSDRLLNGGYDWILIDDRLTYSTVNGNDRISERSRFDLTSAPAGAGPGGGGPGPTAHLRPYRIEGVDDLVAVPISSELRYSIPPGSDVQWERLERHIGAVSAAGAGAIAVYGDDLEKAAGIGPWAPGPWKPENVASYRSLLERLAGRGDCALARPVRISEWLAEHPPAPRRSVEPGTFFELACANGAGEDYRGWWNARAWAPYRRHLVEAEQLLVAEAGRSRLWELAWKQLMACSYETAWHDTMGSAPSGPAPWARAVASHARAVFAIAAAAEWAERDERPARAWIADIDHDGHQELVLGNEHLYAVVTPRYGGRLVYLFDLDGESLVVGNPADDWNWQEELNRFMEVPRNHPGAFADRGHENDAWEIVAARPATVATGAEGVLAQIQPGCPLRGSLKAFRLRSRSPALEVSYRLAGSGGRFDFECALSPDYLTLLREGRAAVQPIGDGCRRGFSAGAASVWCELPDGAPVRWASGPEERCGHGIVLRATAHERWFTVRVGCGGPGGERTRSVLDVRESAPAPAVTAAAEGGP